MTYFKPDRINIIIITWSVRTTILCIALAVVSTAASLALRALSLLGNSLYSFLHPIISAIGSADPMIQLSLELIVFLAFLAIGIKIFMFILRVQGIEKVAI